MHEQHVYRFRLQSPDTQCVPWSLAWTLLSVSTSRMLLSTQRASGIAQAAPAPPSTAAPPHITCVPISPRTFPKACAPFLEVLDAAAHDAAACTGSGPCQLCTGLRVRLSAFGSDDTVNMVNTCDMSHWHTQPQPSQPAHNPGSPRPTIGG